MVNTNKIKGRMKELELTQADVAHCLNIAQPTANQKINNVRPFDLDEAEKLSHLLHIDAGEQIFFYPVSCIMQQAIKEGVRVSGQTIRTFA